MRHFKNHNMQSGQTLIEVAMTIYMIGSLLSAILLLQNSVFSNVTGSVSRMSRLLLLRRYLFEIDLDWKLKKKFSEKKTIEKPLTDLTYKVMAPQEKSALKNFKNISIISLEASWEGQKGVVKEPLIALRHRVTKDKK